MTNRISTTCPECDTPQTSPGPFCENCGYRLGRHDADTDIVPAVTRAGRSVGPKGRLGADSPLRHDTTAEPRAAATTPAATSATTASDGDHQNRTFVEGLRSVGAEDTSIAEPLVDARGSGSFPPPTERSGRFEHHPPLDDGTRTTRVVVLGVLWLVSVGAASIFAYFAAREADDDGAAGAAPAVDRAPVAVPGGPFLQGLAENTRAYILLTCQRMVDDQDLCEQDELLKGEYPQRTVELAPYRIDTTEVTLGDYQGCVDAGDCTPIDFKACEVWTHQGLQVSLRVPKSLQQPDMPATCVTRAQAAAYCASAEGALPSHAQWERAARGTKGRLYPWGDHWASDLANWGEMDVLKTFVVGKLDGWEWAAPSGHFREGKSPVGAHDMAGNVAEWVAGDDPILGHARGGSWASNPFELRTTGRLELEADARRTDVGFRCAYP